MAETTYQDYKRSRMAPPPAADETPAETPVPETETPDEAVQQDSPPASVDAPMQPAEDSDETDEDMPTDQRPRTTRRDRTERRFRRLNDRLRSMGEENAELRGQVDALTKMMTGHPSSTDQPSASRPEGRPSRDDYPDDDDYFEALADWKVEQKDQARRQQQQADQQREQQTSQEREMAALQTAYTEKLEAARDRYEDFDDVVDGSSVQVHQGVIQAIYESEVGPDVVYHLAQHPEEAQRLNTLSPVALGRALARLETTLTPPEEDEPATPPETLPEAPPPIRPVSSGSANTPPVRDPGQLSYRDYKEGRLKGRIR